MADLRLDSEWLTRRARASGIAIAALVAGLLMLDTVALRGEQVVSTSVALGRSDPGVLMLERGGEPHLVQIITRRRLGGETRGRALGIVLADPDGEVIWEDSEIVSRKRRFISFTPLESGAYSLHLEDNTLLAGAGGGSARVSVLVNDQRILRWIPVP